MVPDKTSEIPLFIQIRDELRAGIRSGTMKAGARIPTVTALARERGVTAATIRRAMQDLVAEGLVTTHVGRGTFVSDARPSAPPGAAASKPRADRSGVGQSVARSLAGMMSLAQKKGVIAFTRGIGDPLTVEKGILKRLAADALSSGEEMFWDYGDSRGLPALREAIARLYRARGIDVASGSVLVTSGSQQAISLLAQQAAETGAPVICETPCYAGVTNALAAFGISFGTVPRDGEGPVVSLLPEGKDAEGALLYLCPILHNPTGTDISHARLAEVSAWAARNRATVVSDEVYRDLHFGEAPSRAGDSARQETDERPDAGARAAYEIPSFMKSKAGHDTVALGSLSKSFISGLRVGWIVAPESRIASLTAIKKAMDLGCPPLMQGIARAFLESPDGYGAHRERVLGHYRSLRDVTVDALARHMPAGVTWTTPQGGFQLQIALPAGFSSVELFPRAVERGVAFLPGPLQEIDGRGSGDIRLCYGSLTPEEIREGVKRLAKATDDYLSRGPGNASVAGLGDF